MKALSLWMSEFGTADNLAVVDGIVPVHGYNRIARPPEEVAVMEKAEHYRANAVFFEAPHGGKAPVAQAFLYCADGPEDNVKFAKLHQQLWSWGGVPLVYRFTGGLVQLFRCAHRPDFESKGEIVFSPFKTLDLTSKIVNDPWWDAERLRNGTLWDDPTVCKQLLSCEKAAQKTLINAVKELNQELNEEGILPKPLRRRLLILSILIAYLEKRGVFEDGFFSRFQPGAKEFFEVLANGSALVKLLDYLESRFNGHVFSISVEDQTTLRDSKRLYRFAHMIEGRQEPGSCQLTLWQLYSFADLPVELISHIYQLFVKDTSVAVYTPHFVVRLMLGEVLSWERLDRLEKNDEVILDPACGSGIFLVEAYKRLVLHWRYRNGWKKPSLAILKKLLSKRILGVDVENGAVELAAFSLCLALCDALEPMEIRSSVKLFPALKETTIHTGCFFEACEKKTINNRIGVIVGNPPFESDLKTAGAERAYQKYQKEHGTLSDKQIAYLFLHESMNLLVPGGILTMLQQYNFLYNQLSLDFRRRFFENWDVREILDLISIRGLFKNGGANTKVVVVIAEAQESPSDRQVLHATFRQSGRTNAEQGFDIDYYDMHWLPRSLILQNNYVWRCNLFGGGRVLDFVTRLKKIRTLGMYATEMGWDFGEGFIAGVKGIPRQALHITGKPLLPANAITENGIDTAMIITAAEKRIERPRSEKRFTPPMLLVREHMDLFHGIWTKHYLTYESEIVGICSKNGDDLNKLKNVDAWLKTEYIPLRAFMAAISVRLFTRRATSLSFSDIEQLPYPADNNLDFSTHEQFVASDIVDYYRDLIRLGDKSSAMKDPGLPTLPAFNDIFITRINGVYKKNALRALKEQVWPGVICQPYVFGKGKIDWTGADGLKGKLDALLKEKRGVGLNITRIARLYDGACIYLLKPDRLRFWLRSIALRDADETLADLADQGF